MSKADGKMSLVIGKTKLTGGIMMTTTMMTTKLTTTQTTTPTWKTTTTTTTTTTVTPETTKNEALKGNASGTSRQEGGGRARRQNGGRNVKEEPVAQRHRMVKSFLAPLNFQFYFMNFYFSLLNKVGDEILYNKKISRLFVWPSMLGLSAG